MVEVSAVHKVLLNFEKRAENKTDEVISTTFVDAEPLLDILQAPLSQVIFGRRGTGKTHALKYCLSAARDAGHPALYLDIRSIGSNGSYYSDSSAPEVERGLALVNDILKALLDELYVFAIARIEEGYDSTQVTLRLDDMAKAIGNVRLIGTLEITEEASSTEQESSGINAALEVNTSGAKARVSGEIIDSGDSISSRRVIRSGREARFIDFAHTQIALTGLLQVLNVRKLWIFLDEWSETPRQIQPYLADLIRKTILPTGLVVVKIAAIEQRSSFVIRRDAGDYTGLELGADISADLNLDDFLVFDYDENKATHFFRELIYKNYCALSGEGLEVHSAAELSSMLFTEKRAVEEFTRAVEGVPRDALNLISKIVTKAYGRKAGVDDVRRAALDWYTQDKVNVVNSSPVLHRALNHIIDEVIGNRRARAFLFPANVRHVIIDNLYDARVLHLLKKNVSSRDEPGKRYDVWKIDYGCYVDLIRTQKAPLGLLPDEQETFVEVPSDDYRSIRRAVLLPDDLERFVTE